MKTDRFSSASIRFAAVLLAGLLVTVGLAGAEQRVQIGGMTITFESSSKKLAKAVSQQVKEVQDQFSERRGALRTVRGPGGAQAYLRQEVIGLVADAGKDLDQAIEQIGEPGLDGLLAWAAEELRPVQEELGKTAKHAAASSGLSTPRAIALVASLGWLPPPGLATVKAAAPKQETINFETANRLLDQVGEVVGRIFFLADTNDLEVKLSVCSTPEEKAKFEFWPRGKGKGDAPAHLIIRTNGKRDRVLRGLYAYKAAWSQGQVTELVQSPGSSEPLDLVKGSSFFCCRFKEQYCHHVASEKECRP